VNAWIDRHYHLLRRLHSLSGIFPIGLFLFPHLTTNSSIVWGSMLTDAQVRPDSMPAHAGVETFQHEVNFIHDLPALVLIEWSALFLPIIFHAVLGVWFASSGRPNVDRYKYQGNWRYTVQRASGYLGVVFIFMHVTSLRFGWSWGGLLPAFDVHAAASSTATHFQDGAAGYAAAAFYLLCVLALVFHFANGLWTAAITWGLTISAKAQERWGWVCAAVGVALGAAAITAIAGFTLLDIEQAKAIEASMHAAGH